MLAERAVGLLGPVGCAAQAVGAQAHPSQKRHQGHRLENAAVVQDLALAPQPAPQPRHSPLRRALIGIFAVGRPLAGGASLGLGFGLVRGSVRVVGHPPRVIEPNGPLNEVSRGGGNAQLFGSQPRRESGGGEKSQESIKRRPPPGRRRNTRTRSAAMGCFWLDGDGAYERSYAAEGQTSDVAQQIMRDLCAASLPADTQ